RRTRPPNFLQNAQENLALIPHSISRAPSTARSDHLSWPADAHCRKTSWSCERRLPTYRLRLVRHPIGYFCTRSPCAGEKCKLWSTKPSAERTLMGWCCRLKL